jgi:quinol monooxygenase YgiN
MVRIAELQIDPEQLESYKAVLAEEIDASLRVEAGVLQLEAVSLKEDPTQIRILEVYASAESYQAHLLSPHFKKYKAASEGMVKSLKLYEAEPIRVGTPK